MTDSAAALQRYCFHIAYEGTRYRGWQYQPNVRSVQETLEKALAQVLRLPKVTIVGCGRTDAKVHASQYAFHTDLPPLDPERVCFRLNKTLPPDIAIYEILPVRSDWHARFGAYRRSYDYLLHLGKDPFAETRSMPFYDQPLNLARMVDATALFTQYEDYAGLCRQPHIHNTTICRVTQAELFQSPDGQQLRFHIQANRFLRGQIRILVRKLLDIGIGTFSTEQLEQALATQERPASILPAQPQGLYLSGVWYNSVDLKQRAGFMAERWVLLS